MLCNQSLQRSAFNLLRSVKGTGWTKRPENTGIKVIEFWMRGKVPFCPFRKDGNTKAKKEIFEY